ncbi:hypothetical protein [Psychroserpens sp. NJDZ02]|uniref:hypothetical protein n=1 Tax=Psychroserpens sp. NJDZ02 TaxID=2570561 RepID=UPI0010A75AF8|nr:hypothetical protein [Psychroserpens sp. NJDZ02]QCE42084.1 hypothetical protein E9099_11930 [Psychroserpens sp. NJDZ02]
MKQIIIITFSLTLFLVSCNNSATNQGQREIIPNPEKNVRDDYLKLPDSLKPKFKPDTLIGEISINNSDNVNKYLGKDVMEKLIFKGLPNSSVTSIDRKQRLTFYFHPGNTAKEFSEFKVNYNENKNRKEQVTNDKEFKTESGIKLGMTSGEVRSIKGEPKIITENGTTMFHYKIDDFQNSEFLKKYNMPIYYANYVFKNGYLIEFSFGFEYP